MIADELVRQKVQNAFQQLESSGRKWNKAGLVYDLVQRDPRVTGELFDVFYMSYLYQINTGWKDRITLVELFGRGSVPEPDWNRKLGRFYAIDTQNNRRATKHMSADEFDFAAEKMNQKARSYDHDAQSLRIARGIVSGRLERLEGRREGVLV